MKTSGLRHRPSTVDQYQTELFHWSTSTTELTKLSFSTGRRRPLSYSSGRRRPLEKLSFHGDNLIKEAECIKDLFLIKFKEEKNLLALFIFLGLYLGL